MRICSTELLSGEDAHSVYTSMSSMRRLEHYGTKENRREVYSQGGFLSSLSSRCQFRSQFKTSEGVLLVTKPCQFTRGSNIGVDRFEEDFV